MSVPPPAAQPELPPAPVRAFSARRIAALFGAGFVVCVVVYLAFATPGRWHSASADLPFGVGRLVVSRGSATVNGNEIVVQRPAEDGTTVISVTTDFRAADYPLVAWVAADVPAGGKATLLWHTDVDPSRLNTRALQVVAGRPLPLDVQGDPHWLGRVVGLALAIQGPLDSPLHVRGVVAKPADAFETLRDRIREWVAPETWSGSSINTVTGGAEVQALPLPLLLACAIAVALALSVLLVRTRLRDAWPVVAGCAAALALSGWFVLDARWLLDLGRHARDEAQRYAGKDNTGKHLAADDADLYAFIEQARRVLPDGGARVFVVADADFFRGRAAYHLYPHNVWFDPYRNALPPADRLHAGDWLVVYQRRGIQYDAERHLLRWDGGVTVPATLKLLDHGGALFVVV